MRFFFYGTLLAGNANPVARAIHAAMEPLGAATVAGSLFALPDARGWFPALLEGAGTVHGRLYAATGCFDSALLAAMDAYEEHDPADPHGSLYRRAELPAAKADGGVCMAQAYRFNQPLPPGALPVSGGDFAAFAAARGLPVFAGS